MSSRWASASRSSSTALRRALRTTTAVLGLSLGSSSGGLATGSGLGSSVDDNHGAAGIFWSWRRCFTVVATSGDGARVVRDMGEGVGGQGEGPFGEGAEEAAREGDSGRWSY